MSLFRRPLRNPLPAWAVYAKHSPSGEIRVSLRPAFGRGGVAQLVYCRQLGERVRKRSGYGDLPRPSRITSKGRGSVRDACGYLEQKYKKRLVFATVTLAGSTPAACEALASWSAKVVELFRKWLKYHAPTSEAVWVWELQTRGALHLHAAIGSEDVLELRFLERNIQKYVHHLHETLSRLSGVDVFARNSGGSWKGFPDVLRSNCRPVRKSLKRYMSKYLTKGSTGRRGDSPSRWYGMHQSVRCGIRSATNCFAYSSNHIDRVLDMSRILKTYCTHVGVTFFEYKQKFSVYGFSMILYPPDASGTGMMGDLVNLMSEYAAGFWTLTSGHQLGVF